MEEEGRAKRHEAIEAQKGEGEEGCREYRSTEGERGDWVQGTIEVQRGKGENGCRAVQKYRGGKGRRGAGNFRSTEGERGEGVQGSTEVQRGEGEEGCREDTAWVYDAKTCSLLVYGGWSKRWLGDTWLLGVGRVIGPPYACTGLLPTIGPVFGSTLITIKGARSILCCACK